MIVYVIRHGETDWNKNYMIQGQKDIPLNEEGRRMAEKMREALADVDFDAVFSSPLARAGETAKIIIGNRKIPLFWDDRLKEVDYGAMAGKRLKDILESQQDPCHDFYERPDRYVPPEGAESFEQLFSRSRKFLEEKIIPLEKKYSAVLIVSHGALIRSMINPLSGIPLRDFWKEEMKNCTAAVLLLDDGKWEVLERNREYF